MAQVVSIDLSDFDRLNRDLEKFAKSAVPYATRDTLNNLAFESRKIWVSEIDKTMVLRNRWTVGSIRVERARGTNVAAMQSVLGSVSPYMLAQEEGKQQQLGGRIAVPTSAAAGQQGAKPRTRLVRSANTLQAIKLAKRQGRGNRQQRNAVAMAQAAREGRKTVYLELAKGRGLFRIMGGERRPRVTMLWSFEQASPKIPRNPTLERTVDQAVVIGPRIASAAMIRQLQRAKVLGY